MNSPEPVPTPFSLAKIDLQQIVHQGHPLAKLACEVEWKAFDKKWGAEFTNTEHLIFATRLMVALHYLKYAHHLTDAETLVLWAMNPSWQYFCGKQYFEYGPPTDILTLEQWRKHAGFTEPWAFMEEFNKFLKTSQALPLTASKSSLLSRF